MVLLVTGKLSYPPNVVLYQRSLILGVVVGGRVGFSCLPKKELRKAHDDESTVFAMEERT